MLGDAAADGIDTRSAVPALVDALRDPSYQTRLQATVALMHAAPHDRSFQRENLAAHLEILRYGVEEEPMFAAYQIRCILLGLDRADRQAAVEALDHALRRGVRGAGGVREVRDEILSGLPD